MRCLGLVAILFAGVALANSKDVQQLSGVRFSVPPVIDGVLSDGEWEEAAKSKGFTDPYTGSAPLDDTTVWIAYDHEAIYVAFFCHDSQPSRIVAVSRQPGTVQGVRTGGGGFGGGSVTEDVIEFQIDPFNTRQGGMSEFRVNPLGTTSENIAGGRSSKREFRGEWQAAAKIVEGGWVVEMRVPWAILNTPRGSVKNMDINFARAQARTQISSMWANTTLRSLPELNGLWEGVEPPPGAGASKLNLLGYMAPEYDEDAKDTFTFRAGADVRYAFTTQLTGLASFNPDFKNIEQEVTSIAFTRSARFERDNRPFFTEGSSFFGGGGGGGGFSDQLFYSRAISDFDQGAKVYGKLDRLTSVGLLMTGEDGDRLDGVFSVSRILGSRSSARILATSTSATGIENTAVSVSGRHGTGNYNINGEYAVVNDGGPSDTSGRFGVSYNIPRFTTSLTYSWVDPDYSPSLGFVRFRDRRGVSLFASHSSEYRTGPLRSFSAFVFGSNFQTFENNNQQKGLGLNVNGTFRSDVSLSLGLDTERFEDEEERTASIGMEFNVSNRFNRYGFDYTFGERDNEHTSFLSLGASRRLSEGLDVGLRHSALNFMGSSDQSILTVSWEIDEKQSLAARAVRRDGDLNYYVSYSSSGFTGLDWFLIIGDPNASEWRNRVSLKFVWAR